jgi:hypothetical protein
MLKMMRYGENQERMRPLEKLAGLHIRPIIWYIYAIHCSQG